MKMNNFSKKILVAVLLVGGSLLGVNSSAIAALETQTFSYAGSPATLASAPWTYGFLLDQINLAPGGVLNSVEIIANSDLSSSISVTNTGAGILHVNHAGTSMDMYLNGDSSVLSNAFGPYPIGNPLVSSQAINNHGFNLGIGGSTNYTSVTTATYSQSFTSGLGEFIGSGTLAEQIAANPGTVFDVVGTGLEGQNPQADITMQVVYDYSGNINVGSVPEPSALLLFGMGGLICWGWRRKATC